MSKLGRRILAEPDRSRDSRYRYAEFFAFLYPWDFAVAKAWLRVLGAPHNFMGTYLVEVSEKFVVPFEDGLEGLSYHLEGHWTTEAEP